MVDATRVPIIFEIRNAEDLRKANALLTKMGQPGGPVGKATKTTARFGSSVQNASFQITDFIVQVEGGVSATRALGQQLPQLLGAFGALGAAAGVVVSLFPAVVRAFQAGAEEVKDLDEAISDLNDSLGEFDDQSALFTGQKIANNLKDVTAALREQAKAYREISLLQKAINLFESGLFIRRNDEQAQIIDNLQEQLNVTRDVAQQIDVLNRQFSIGFISADQYAKGITEITQSADNASDELIALAESARAVLKPVEQLQEVQTRAKRQKVPVILGVNAAGPSASAAGTSGYTQQELAFLKELQKVQEQVTDSTKDNVSQVDKLFTTLENNWSTVVDGIAQGTQSIDDAFKSMAQSVIAELGRIAAKWAATQVVSALFGSPTAAADGMVVQNGVKKFAKGGIVNRPTLFPLANGAGLMGEAGAEAILPLGRNRRGELGVKGGGVNVTINNMAPGVDVRTRETENGLTLDIVMQSMSNAVRQGGNMFSEAVEQSYSLSRGAGVY